MLHLYTSGLSCVVEFSAYIWGVLYGAGAGLGAALGYTWWVAVAVAPSLTSTSNSTCISSLRSVFLNPDMKVLFCRLTNDLREKLKRKRKRKVYIKERRGSDLAT